MTGHINIEGIPYVHIKIASRGTGLSHDYISKFCRRGSIRSVRIDKTWYVDLQSLHDFLNTHRAAKDEWKKRQSERRRSEQVELGFRRLAPATLASSLPKLRVAPIHVRQRLMRAHAWSKRRSALIANTAVTLVLSGIVFASALSISPASQQRGTLAAAGEVGSRVESLARVYNILSTF